MDQFRFGAITKVLLLYYLLCPFLELSVGAHECVKLPSAPLHGKLLGPFGFLVARLVCPEGKDISLNVRNGGLLECNPMEKSYSFIDVPRHECLPLKHPDSLVMYLELIYTRSDCTFPLKRDLMLAVVDKLRNLNISIKDSGLNTQWGHVKVECGGNDPRMIRSSRDNSRYDVTVPLKFSPYDPTKSYEFYLQLLARVKQNYFNRINFDFSPQKIWSVIGFKLLSTSYSPLFSSCDKQPNTAGINVQYHRQASCRGCQRDFYLDKRSEKCGVCSIREYTLGPFSNSCIPCPPQEEWKEDKEAYLAYCGRLQADYETS